MPNTQTTSPQELAKKLQTIGAAFHLPGLFFSYEEVRAGNVNHTYKVNYIMDDGQGMARIKSYIVQRLNSFAFRNPIQLMENIDKVTEHIRRKRPGAMNLHYHHTDVTGERKTFLMEGKDLWRIINYVPSITCDSCEDPQVVRNAGIAFGDFQKSLEDFQATELAETIPDFHNTRKRYQQLREAIQENPCGRYAEVQSEAESLLSVESSACRLTDLEKARELPLRVTHNDTKINNVLFDPNTRQALVVIDLDTVMPGLVAHDFGDAIRFAANFTEEDSQDTAKTGLDLNTYWAFADGFLSQTATGLTDTELNTLGHSPFCLACELATRFLTDYLLGDPYFKIRYPEHNLVRARCQIALSRDMAVKLDAMQAIVDGCAKKYR